MSLTAETLLASLHKHLAFHTALLPQLHAQLGLPPTALATELEELRTVLADAVEAWVERRRKDVAAWVERCEEVERKCKQYATAVGGPTITRTIKGIKPVAELAKEQNYPKRYELLQKNLQLISRVHATKLEQLSTLHARLRTLAEALGHDFFPPDLLPPPAELSPSENPDQPVASASTGAISTRSSPLAVSSFRHPDLTLSALGPVPFSVSTSTSSVLPRSTSPADTPPVPSGSILPIPLPLPKPDILPPDVSPARFARLNRELQRAKQALSGRRSRLARTLLHASWLMLEMGMALPCEEDGWEDGDEGDQVFVKFLKELREAEAEMEANGEAVCENGADDGTKAVMRAVEGIVPKVSIIAWAKLRVETDGSKLQVKKDPGADEDEGTPGHDAPSQPAADIFAGLIPAQINYLAAIPKTLVHRTLTGEALDAGKRILFCYRRYSFRQRVAAWFAVRTIWGVYSRYRLRNKIPHTSTDDRIRKLHDEYKKDVERIDCPLLLVEAFRKHAQILLGPMPHVVVYLYGLERIVQKQKESIKKRLQKVQHEELERVQAKMTICSALSKAFKKLTPKVLPGQFESALRNMETLRAKVQEVEALRSAVMQGFGESAIPSDLEQHFKLGVYIILAPSAESNPPKPPKPGLNTSDLGL